MLNPTPGIAGFLKPEDFELIFDAIMSHSRDGLFVVDKTGVVVMVNKATEDMFSFNKADVLGRNVRDLVSEGFYEPSVSVLVIEQKKILSLIQTTRHKKKVLSTGIPIFDDAGEVQFVLVNDRDISHINELAQSLYLSEMPSQGLRMDYSKGDIASTELEKMVVKSPLMVQVVQTAVQASKFDIPMIITGESGVGKSMIARLVHQLSPRRNYPFVDVNCAALTPSLVESELFGHEGGAFTGASATAQKGLFETADQGTLFLDEIGEIPLSMQVKLLKFLETMELRRVGGTTPIKINTRIIAATNQNLEEMVETGRFRRDLYFRLNVVPMRIPALGRRSEDIVPLAQSFIDRFNQEFDTNKILTKPVCQMLSQYHFPGNVRELENLIKRLVTMTPQDKSELAHLPPLVPQSGRERPTPVSHQPHIHEHPPVQALAPQEKPAPPSYQNEVNHFERELLRQAVVQYGSQRKAAKALGISQSTLSRKLKP